MRSGCIFHISPCYPSMYICKSMSQLLCMKTTLLRPWGVGRWWRIKNHMGYVERPLLRLSEDALGLDARLTDPHQFLADWESPLILITEISNRPLSKTNSRPPEIDQLIACPCRSSRTRRRGSFICFFTAFFIAVSIPKPTYKTIN